ncbi:MAG: YbdD/YjiX family protein [Luteimonas sp.]
MLRSKREMKIVSAALVAAASKAWTWATRTARLAVGVPDYDVYIAHMQRMHPDAVPMDHESFFAERLQARYSKNRSRCC